MSDIDTVAFFKAKQELNQFLRDNPHMYRQQATIDRMLVNVRDPMSRLKILMNVIDMNIKELGQLSCRLNDLIGSKEK